MKILVTNDDGINAEGINCLVKALSKVGEVYVVAPDSQRSGASHSITMNEKLYFTEAEVEGAVKAYAFTGTPADCVKMGIAILEMDGIEVDLVFSGINHGGNLGTDTLYSGTVGAAREGLMNGKMSVALSVNSHDANEFEYACDIAIDAAHILFKEERAKKAPCMLNINVPNLPKREIKGLKITKLGIRNYEDWFNPNVLDDGRIEISYGGNPISGKGGTPKREEMEDVLAMEKRYATITPLKHDLTCLRTLDSDIWRIYNEKFTD